MYIAKRRLKTQIPVRRALTRLVGIGLFSSNQVCDQLGFPSKLKVSHLNFSERERLVRLLSDYYIFEMKLRKENRSDIKRLMHIKSLRGMRLRDGLPVRGQRTHTNAKTSQKKRRL